MQRSSPILTVIMPVFNTGRYVRDAVASVLNQSFRDFELLVGDDGSSDNSVDVVRSFNDSRIRVFTFSENEGKVAVCNRLFEQAQGRYATIHDSDDISAPTRFEKQIAFLDDNEDYGMCGTFFREIDRRGKVIRDVALESDPDTLQELIKTDSQFHGPTMVFRTDIVKKAGGLYRDFRNKEDVDLSMRIAEKSLVKNLNEYLYYYRLVPQGLSKVNFDILRFEGLTVLQKLAEQRRVEGQDCLMKGDTEAYNRLLEEIGRPYREDPSLLYRKGVALNVYFKFWTNAFQYALKAVAANPAKWINYREFLYVVKVRLAHLFSRHAGGL
jgi:glycosyltransferase involved in cell wall biosynthesis